MRVGLRRVKPPLGEPTVAKATSNYVALSDRIAETRLSVAGKTVANATTIPSLSATEEIHSPATVAKPAPSFHRSRKARSNPASALTKDAYRKFLRRLRSVPR